MTAPRDEFAELLHALVTGNVVDGVPITSSTIGQLMHEYRYALQTMIAQPGDTEVDR